MFCALLQGAIQALREGDACPLLGKSCRFPSSPNRKAANEQRKKPSHSGRAPGLEPSFGNTLSHNTFKT